MKCVTINWGSFFLSTRDINPHIPQYISSVPWYIDPSKRPTLKHQRPQDEKQPLFSSIGEWYKRGVQEVQLALDYDGKRDRWNGYDPEEHQRIVEEYAKVDLEREYDSEDEDEDKYADDIDMPGQNFDSKRRITEHLDAPPRELLLAQTEDYVEYSRHGAVLKGLEKAVARSKYEEDVLINNHTCIWGSYWKDGYWGYKCCHSLVKQSYCTGQAGIQTVTSHMSTQALEAEDKRVKHIDSLMQLDERKRPYYSLQEVKAPTEEEMEAFRMKRSRPDDPMASFLGQ
ncbi:hypothetical protein GOODEAATRI_006206 [Goodea atripinnis]|uniref:Pre-mRNA-splicing factor SLU7 n=1 Tax=Goodea atripinnis TaxID=208336 RepID=A0ABV0N8C4_9TELE